MGSLPLRAPFAARSRRARLGGHRAEDARSAPYTWERTLVRCVIRKHGLRLGPGPPVCTRQGRQQMYPEGEGAPSRVLSVQPYWGEQFTETKCNQPGMKRTTNLFNLGEFFEDPR